MHARPVILAIVLASAWTCRLACAQLPPNAVPLAPNGNVGRATVVHEGHELHAFWSAAGRTYYNRSTDGGLSWLPAEQMLSPGGFLATAVEGRNVYCVVGSANGPLLLRSQDGGVWWLAPVPISTQSTSCSNCGLWAGSGSLAVVWQEPRAGVGSLFANQSLDGGTTWRQFDTCLDAGLSASSEPSFAADGPVIHVLWTTWSSATTGQALHQRSLDHGTTWLPMPTSLGPGSVQGAATSGSTVLALINRSVLRSTDLGNTWALVPGPSFLWIAMSGNVVIGADSVTLRVNRSLDGGATWLPSPIQLYSVIGVFDVEISIAGGTVVLYANVMRSCCLVFDVYLYVSSDGGTTWRMIGWRPQPGILAPKCWPLDDGHLIIEDPMNAYVVAGYGSYGLPKPGTGGINPELAGTGVPMLGRSLNVSLGHALGGSPALIGFSFSGRANTPWGSGTILVAPPVATLWSITSGTPNAPGAGAMAVPLAIANNQVFAGMRVDLQGFVLDPGAADGIASTAGMEIWVH